MILSSTPGGGTGVISDGFSCSPIISFGVFRFSSLGSKGWPPPWPIRSAGKTVYPMGATVPGHVFPPAPIPVGSLQKRKYVGFPAEVSRYCE
jgi:hypothetical protein